MAQSFDPVGKGVVVKGALISGYGGQVSERPRA